MKLPIKLAFNTSKGYHMQLHIKQQNLSDELFKDFIRVCKSKNSVTFTTNKLISLNDRINELTHNICNLSNR